MNQPIAIVGTGRVASVLGQALHHHAVPIAAVAGRNPAAIEQLAITLAAPPLVDIREVVRYCDCALVAVSDDALEVVLPQLAGCRIVLHTSGAAGFIATLGIEASGVFHPLQTFPDTRPRDLSQSSIAYGGDVAAAARALELIHILGATPLRVASGKWAQYHAAAVFASNYQVTLLDIAFELMQAAGINAAAAALAVGPLTGAAIDLVFRYGIDAALTGPIRRGDVNTIRRHLSVLGDSDMRDLYISLARRTLPIAARLGVDSQQIREVLS